MFYDSKILTMHVFNKIWIRMLYTCVYVCICVSVSYLGYSPCSTVFLKKSISFTIVLPGTKPGISMHSETFIEQMNKYTNKWNIYKEIVYANTKMIPVAISHGDMDDFYFLLFAFLYFLVLASFTFPGDSDCKESISNAADLSLIPGLGRSPGEGYSNSLQYSCLGNPTDRGA